MSKYQEAKIKYLDRFSLQISSDFTEEGGTMTYIDTDRLNIASINTATEEEFDVLYRSTFGNKEVMRTFGPGTTRTGEDFDQLMKVQLLRWNHNYPFGGLIIKDKDKNDAVIGYVSIGERQGDAGELIYLVCKDYWGNGIGYESAGAAFFVHGEYCHQKEIPINCTFNPAMNKYEGGQKIARVHSTAMTENYASLKILRKLGLVQKPEPKEIYGAMRYEFDGYFEGVELIGDTIYQCQAGTTSLFIESPI